MKKFFFLFVSIIQLHGWAQEKSDADLLPFLDIESLLDDKNTSNMSVTEIIEHTEKSIKANHTISIPAQATELEKVIFTIRRLQHNDSQLVAIKYVKTLLDFECYRSEAEKLYLKYLLASSLKSIGAPLVAKKYVNEVFPKLLSFIDSELIKGHLIGYYAGFMIKQDSLERASELYTDNLLRYEKLGNHERIYQARNNLGYVSYLQKNYPKAKQLYKNNQVSSFKDENITLYAFAFGNYGTILRDEHLYDSAIYYFNKEVSILNEHHIQTGLVNIFLSIAEAFELKNELDSAKKYYNRGIEKAKEMGRTAAVVDGLEGLLRIYTTKSNDDNLKHTIEQYHLFNDSLRNEVSMNAVQDEIQVSRFLEILAETERSRKKNQKLESQNRELLLSISLLVLLLALLIVIITLRNRNRKKIEAKNLLLESNNKELEQSYLLISETNSKNELLLKELHHRVKNNLQIVSSLFSLQLNAKNLDSKAEEVFQDAQNRIHSISLVHKKLYQSNNFERLDFKEYLHAIGEDIISSQIKKVSIELNVECPPIPVDTAIPLGLIFNELFTNSLKHATGTNNLVVSIAYISENNHGTFIYKDNGIGIQNIEMMKEKEESIGVTLIHLLAEQIDVTVEYQESTTKNNGFWISLTGNFTD